jgi:hypothetical protein
MDHVITGSPSPAVAAYGGHAVIGPVQAETQYMRAQRQVRTTADWLIADRGADRSDNPNHLTERKATPLARTSASSASQRVRSSSGRCAEQCPSRSTTGRSSRDGGCNCELAEGFGVAGRTQKPEAPYKSPGLSDLSAGICRTACSSGLARRKLTGTKIAPSRKAANMVTRNAGLLSPR